MEGMRLLHKLRLTNFLSYGPEGTEIELQPLNVLIGPNGSGKSNLIEAISLLKAAPTDISKPIREGGGMPQWIWKGEGRGYSLEVQVEAVPTARLVAHSFPVPRPLRHTLALRLGTAVQDVWLDAERIDDLAPSLVGSPSLYRYGENKSGRLLEALLGPHQNWDCYLNDRPMHATGLDFRQSILAQIKDPVQHPRITELGRSYGEIGLFREWNAGPHSPLRGPQRADEPASFLLGNGRNLGIVLNDLLNRPATKKLLLGQLQRFYGGVEDITSKVYANTVETFLHEHGFSDSTPSVRLSDGTLRYLCLLTILCHPEPPPLVCIEDPEVGLHPDILPIVAELLLDASQRMQLIVTTHSDILVSALSHVPEAVVVCERDDAGSHLQRLDPDRLKEWLKKYSLGEYWVIGGLGGVT